MYFVVVRLFKWSKSSKSECLLSWQELLSLKTMFSIPRITGHQWHTVLWPCGQQWCGLVTSTKMSLRPHIFSSIPFGFMYQGFEINASCAATFLQKRQIHFCSSQSTKTNSNVCPGSMTFLLGRNKFQGKLFIKASYIFRRGSEMFLLCCPKAWIIILKVERMVYFLSTKCWNYPIV